MANRDPDEQFQLGDPVVYVPEGIYCVVDGYVWMLTIGRPPRVIGYRLSCGVEAEAAYIARDRRENND